MKSYHLVMGSEQDKSLLVQVNAFQDNYSAPSLPFEQLAVALDEPKSVAGVNLPAGMPAVVVDTKRALGTPTLLDDGLIEQIAGYFSHRSRGVTVEIDDLRRFLRGHKGKYVICIGS